MRWHWEELPSFLVSIYLFKYIPFYPIYISPTLSSIHFNLSMYHLFLSIYLSIFIVFLTTILSTNRTIPSSLQELCMDKLTQVDNNVLEHITDPKNRNKNVNKNDRTNQDKDKNNNKEKTDNNNEEEEEEEKGIRELSIQECTQLNAISIEIVARNCNTHLVKIILSWCARYIQSYPSNQSIHPSIINLSNQSIRSNYEKRTNGI